jgi:hypothetical protein
MPLSRSKKVSITFGQPPRSAIVKSVFGLGYRFASTSSGRIER